MLHTRERQAKILLNYCFRSFFSVNMKMQQFILIVCSYVMYGFQSKSALYSCLNVKELFAWNRRDNWSLSDSNGIRTYNLLVRKQKLDHLAKLAKWLMCCEYLSLWCIWLYVIIMLSTTRFRVNLHSHSTQSFGQFGRMVECSFTN